MAEKIMLETPDYFPSFNYTYVCGAVDTGYVIQDEKGNQYTWIPGGKYRRRNIWIQYLVEGEIEGFWIMRYEASKGWKKRPCSIPRRKPWIDISYEEAKQKAEEMGGKLPSSKQWSRYCEWILELGIATFEQIHFDSSSLGYYGGDILKFKGLIRTGSNPQYMLGNVDNMTGNTLCILEEKGMYGGGRAFKEGTYYTDALAWYGFKNDKDFEGDFFTGFRVVF